MLFVNFVF